MKSLPAAAATAVFPGGRFTNAAGSLVPVVVPKPSSPSELSPQHQIEALSRIAQVWRSPEVMETAVLNEAIWDQLCEPCP